MWGYRNTQLYIHNSLEVVSDVCSGLKEEENDVQVGVCGFTKTVKGMICVCMSRTQYM